MGISKLDTVKDKDGKRFRVADVRTVDGQIIAVLKGIHADGSPRRGGARNVRADVLERDYTRIDLPPVTIRKIDDLKGEKKQMVKEPTPSERASLIEAQAVRELSRKDIEKAVETSTFGGDDVKVKKGKIGQKPIEELTVVELLDDARADNYTTSKGRLWVAADSFGMSDIAVLKDELINMKKTISKMKQSHEAEVLDLKDQLMEAQAEAKAVKRTKEEMTAERNECVDALDEDRVTLEAIMHLAEVIQLVSTSAAKIAKEIIEKTEERI